MIMIIVINQKINYGLNSKESSIKMKKTFFDRRKIDRRP